MASAGNHVIAVARRAVWPSEATRSKESEAYCNRSLTSCAAAEKPPHRLLLGGPAYEMAMHELDELLAEFSTWERLTRSADFPSTVLITPVR